MSDRSRRTIRRRGMKVNSKQKKILMQFMADYPTIYYNRLTADFSQDQHNAFWQNMSSVLNIFGPPRKTMDSWKKAWKDMRLRYRKAGIDMKQIINTLKSETVVNTRGLLESVEKLVSNDVAEVERLLKEHGLDSSPSRSPFFKNADDAARAKIDLSKTMDMAAELGLTRLQEKLKMEVESRTVDDLKPEDENCAELFLAVEEVLESDCEYTNDTVIEGSAKDQEELRLSKELDLDAENMGERPEVHFNEKDKRDPVNGTKTPTNLCENLRSESKRNILNDFLGELRLMNKIEKEKLTMKKNFIEYQKLMMQHTLSVQKEIAKAQASLANTVKTFVDNIAFNS